MLRAGRVSLCSPLLVEQLSGMLVQDYGAL